MTNSLLLDGSAIIQRNEKNDMRNKNFRSNETIILETQKNDIEKKKNNIEH